MRRRFLPSLQVKDAGTLRRVAAAVAYRTRGLPYQTMWDVDRAVRDGFERVLWVYRCVDAIATNQARAPIQLRKGARDGPVVDGTGLDILRLLNRRPNGYETAEQFRYRLSCQLLLSKQGVFIELVPSNSGGLAEIHLLPPSRTAPIPGAVFETYRNPLQPGEVPPPPPRFVDGYRVTYASGGWYDLEPNRVLWIRKPHPTDPYQGVTPLEASGLTADIDFYARLFNRNFLLNDGRPGGLVAVKGELSQEDAKELKQRFQGGPQQAGRTTVIEADEVSWVDTATTPRDAQYVQMLTTTKNDLLLAFGTPESVLGNASNRTYDNAGAEEAIFWRVTMIPHCELIDGAFDTLTPGSIDDDLFLVHDTSGIAPLQRDKREKDAKLLQEYQAGAITLDMYLEGTGRKAINVPGSRVFWVPTGKIGVGSDEDQTAVAALMAAGTGGAGAMGGMPGAGLPLSNDPNAYDTYAQQPQIDYNRGGWQADAQAQELDRVANGGGNNTGNGTLDPRGNGLAVGVKRRRALGRGDDGLELKALPMPGDVAPAELSGILELLDAAVG